jgi:predicted AAA+ superfamily ATPase
MYYYNFDSNYTLDFIQNIKFNVIPIEVKAGKTKKKKSLTSYNKKFNPKFAIRFSTNDYLHNGKIINIPL